MRVCDKLFKVFDHNIVKIFVKFYNYGSIISMKTCATLFYAATFDKIAESCG